MSPRPYRLGQRQVATDQTRERILVAARDVLAAEQGPYHFTMDSVAEAAGVARMTVYYQFGSRAGVLEALFDWLAARGGMGQLPLAFQQADPRQGLAHFVATFVQFWASDPVGLRRLRALATLDPDLEALVRSRDDRRRESLRVLLGRLTQQRALSKEQPADTLIDVVYALTSFETFDSLSSAGRSAEEVRGLIQRLVDDFSH